ncbi:hypothetical protein RSAG8_13110, partial [Rhizoctonia solani AG-8 WAC10335]
MGKAASAVPSFLTLMDSEAPDAPLFIENSLMKGHVHLEQQLEQIQTEVVQDSERMAYGFEQVAHTQAALGPE